MHLSSTKLNMSPVSYLFRTTGQVLGVSLSGTLLQAVLLSKLRQRVHVPNAEAVWFRLFYLDSSRTKYNIIAHLTHKVKEVALYYKHRHDI
jgi:hypothetical protein